MEGAIGLEEAGVRAEREAHRLQPKAKGWPALFLNSFAFAE